MHLSVETNVYQLNWLNLSVKIFDLFISFAQLFLFMLKRVIRVEKSSKCGFNEMTLKNSKESARNELGTKSQFTCHQQLVQIYDDNRRFQIARLRRGGVFQFSSVKVSLFHLLELYGDKSLFCVSNVMQEASNRYCLLTIADNIRILSSEGFLR
ncbi:hypothetical protein EGR_08492 [Echinococcus granulosus]|uniref:Uncharacterized protein n=1 Tax=Echinococcus granulosus TaxID=6210 RepID=W6U8C9_ECHGR|nr:hypothetical protein EGR_08492 [Echinococcus granulosus]EUB56631.1 hypothetical protein EGR_08492 [Echinococcus granulosus]